MYTRWRSVRRLTSFRLFPASTIALPTRGLSVRLTTALTVCGKTVCFTCYWCWVPRGLDCPCITSPRRQLIQITITYFLLFRCWDQYETKHVYFLSVRLSVTIVICMKTKRLDDHVIGHYRELNPPPALKIMWTLKNTNCYLAPVGKCRTNRCLGEYCLLSCNWSWNCKINNSRWVNPDRHETRVV